mmetsp:Transcript_30877/g.47329  ORF Transcript_30877/g.47329 Transcript_30877/m.47329 type:complete len:173 (+) Transcript_30877:235-753(+)
MVSNECPYVSKLHNVSNLCVLQPNNVCSAYNDRKECGLFHLFVKKNFSNMYTILGKQQFGFEREEESEKQNQQSLSAKTASLDEEMMTVIGEDLSKHLLLPTLERKRIQCLVCKTIDNSKQRKAHFCCTECRVSFRPECFTIFHHRNALATHQKALYKLVKASNGDSKHQNK